MLNDDCFDDLLREAANDYNRPPETPSRVMWSRISARRAWQGDPRPRRRPVLVAWVATMAASLLVGIALGRHSAPPGDVRALASGSAPAKQEQDGSLHAGRPASGQPNEKGGGAPQYALATREYVRGAETLLVRVAAQEQPPTLDAVVAQARDLLLTTRLLLDSPIGDDPARALLLEDLELVLTQVSQLRTGNDADRALVTDAIVQNGLIERLRTVGADQPSRVQS
jgi:hypothetical protein